VRATQFFDSHPVFRHDEFVAAHTAGGRSSVTSNNLLAQHVASGRLLRIRKGLYATVQRGQDPRTATVDPYLLATRLTADSSVAYHAAMQFHGRAYSVWHRFHYLTAQRTRRFAFRGMEFIPVRAPAPLRDLPQLGGGISEVDHNGGQARVTTLERTLVDLLDAPDKGGGWEEIWRSLEMVEFFDIDAVTRYALALGTAVTIARVGLFLQQHSQSLMVEEPSLERLRTEAPRQPRYFDPRRRSGRLIQDWNLIVPTEVLERRWGAEG
jgi:predicted transcriptional regulator of viral defense system